jgi:hypothetical protein
MRYIYMYIYNHVNIQKCIINTTVNCNNSGETPEPCTIRGLGMIYIIHLVTSAIMDFQTPGKSLSLEHVGK